MATTRRTTHIRLAEADADRIGDMLRYICYRGQPETAEPVRVKWAGSPVTVHRFTKDGWTYFRKPAHLNNYWATGGVGRWASFGIKAEIVLA